MGNYVIFPIFIITYLITVIYTVFEEAVVACSFQGNPCPWHPKA